MKILLYGINYAPELTGIGKYSGEMAAWLAARGHDVRVITAPPYYPQWRVAPDQRARWWRRQRRDGVRITRCPLYVPKNPSGKRRVLHLASFAASSLPVALGAGLVGRPDVVVTVEPTALVAPAAWAAARLGGARAWLHVQDLEIDAAFDLGLLPAGGFAQRSAMRVERWLLRRFERVSTIAPRMAERLAAKGVAAERLALFPNWVDCAAIKPLDGPSPLRAEFGVAASTTLALYSGNMGEKQGLGTLVEAARASAARDDILWLLVGDGAARERLAASAADVKNVRFKPLQPAPRLNDLLNAADIHLLPQRADVADLVLPSKLSGMLASGRPVVAGAAPGTQVRRLVEGCGVSVAPGDAAAFAAAVTALADAPDRRRALGATARPRALEHWDRDAVLGRFEAMLEAAARG